MNNHLTPEMSTYRNAITESQPDIVRTVNLTNVEVKIEELVTRSDHSHLGIKLKKIRIEKLGCDLDYGRKDIISFFKQDKIAMEVL